MDGNIDLISLNKNLDIFLPDDAKIYLKQLGLEDDELRQYLPSNPGKYYDNVPLEENPEAYLDILSRESIRRKSDQKLGSPKHKVAPKKINNDISDQADVVEDAPVTDDELIQNEAQNTSSGNYQASKSVSFTDNIQETDINSHIDHSKSKNTHSTAQEIYAKKLRKARAYKTNPSCPISCFSTACAYGYATAAILHQKHSATSQNETKGYNNIENEEISSKMSKKITNFFGIRAKKINSEKNIIEEDIPEKNILDSDNDSKTEFENVELIDNDIVVCHDSKTPSQPLDLTENLSDHCINESMSLPDNDSLNSSLSNLLVPEHSSNQFIQCSSCCKSVSNQNQRNNTVEIISNEQTKNHQTTKQALKKQKLPKILLNAMEGDADTLRMQLTRMSEKDLLHIRDNDGNTAMHIACEYAHLEIVEILHRKACRLLNAENKLKLTPAGVAIKFGKIEILDWLVEKTTLRDDRSSGTRRPLLHVAAKYGQDGCLRLLLTKLGAMGDIENSRDIAGNTPAHLAAKYGHITCLQTLVEFGVDVCQPNLQNHTPCYYADFNNHRHSAGYLIAVEMCRRLAEQHISTVNMQNRLMKEQEELRDHLKDSFAFNAAILKQWQQQQSGSGTFAILEECSDLMREMMSQIEAVFTENCVMKTRYIGSQDNRYMRAEILDKLNRAKALRRRIDKLEKPAKQTTVKQLWMRVKDMERRLVDLMQSSHSPEPISPTDAHMLMREMFSDEIKKLVVYRTSLKNWDDKKQEMENESKDSSLPRNNLRLVENKLGDIYDGKVKQVNKSSEVPSNDQNILKPRKKSYNDVAISTDTEKHFYENVNEISSSNSKKDLSDKKNNLLGSSDKKSSSFDSYSSHYTSKIPSKNNDFGTFNTIPYHGEPGKNTHSFNTPGLNVSYNLTGQKDLFHHSNSNGISSEIGSSYNHSAFKQVESSRSLINKEKDKFILEQKENFSIDTNDFPDFANFKFHNSEMVTSPIIEPPSMFTMSNIDDDIIHSGSEMNLDELDQIDSVSQIGEDTSMPTSPWGGNTQHDISTVTPQNKAVKNIVLGNSGIRYTDVSLENWSDEDSIEMSDEDELSCCDNDNVKTDKEVKDFVIKQHEVKITDLELFDHHDEYDEDEEIIMDPNLRILPSMQFDMQLSTIDEVSIASGSTRADDDSSATSGSKRNINKIQMKVLHEIPDDRPWYEHSDDEDRIERI